MNIKTNNHYNIVHNFPSEVYLKDMEEYHEYRCFEGESHVQGIEYTSSNLESFIVSKFEFMKALNEANTTDDVDKVFLPPLFPNGHSIPNLKFNTLLYIAEQYYKFTEELYKAEKMYNKMDQNNKYKLETELTKKIKSGISSIGGTIKKMGALMQVIDIDIKQTLTKEKNEDFKNIHLFMNIGQDNTFEKRELNFTEFALDLFDHKKNIIAHSQGESEYIKNLQTIDVILSEFLKGKSIKLSHFNEKKIESLGEEFMPIFRIYGNIVNILNNIMSNNKQNTETYRVLQYLESEIEEYFRLSKCSVNINIGNIYKRCQDDKLKECFKGKMGDIVIWLINLIITSHTESEHNIFDQNVKKDDEPDSDDSEKDK